METLHLIDRGFERLLPDVGADPRTVLHEGDSAERVAGLADASAGWIYIDADHRYDGCRADAQAAKAKLKPEGLLFFNDYSVWAPMNFLAWGACGRSRVPGGGVDPAGHHPRRSVRIA